MKDKYYICTELEVRYPDGRMVLSGWAKYVYLGYLYKIKKNTTEHNGFDVYVVTPEEEYITCWINHDQLQKYFKPLRDINLEKVLNCT